MPLRTLNFGSPAKLADFSSVAQEILTAAVVAGGSEYQLNDILSVVDGDYKELARLKVTAEVAGAITGIAVEFEGAYSTVPSNPVSVVGGSGNDDATFNLTAGPAITQSDVVDIAFKSGRWYLAYSA